MVPRVVPKPPPPHPVKSAYFAMYEVMIVFIVGNEALNKQLYLQIGFAFYLSLSHTHVRKSTMTLTHMFRHDIQKTVWWMRVFGYAALCLIKYVTVVWRRIRNWMLWCFYNTLRESSVCDPLFVTTDCTEGMAYFLVTLLRMYTHTHTRTYARTHTRTHTHTHTHTYISLS
jgi:hypothetical protein